MRTLCDQNTISTISKINSIPTMFPNRLRGPEKKKNYSFHSGDLFLFAPFPLQELPLWSKLSIFRKDHDSLSSLQARRTCFQSTLHANQFTLSNQTGILTRASRLTLRPARGRHVLLQRAYTKRAVPASCHITREVGQYDCTIYDTQDVVQNLQLEDDSSSQVTRH
jgi:hypothetical protein